MKNLRFVSGLLLGLILGTFLSFIITCKSEPASQTQQAQNSFTYVEGLNNYPSSVYKLNIDNVQYIVVSNGNNGGIAIIKHK